MVGSAGTAQASPISFSDAFDPTDVFMANVPAVVAACTGVNGAVIDTVSGAVGGACETLSYVHTIQPAYDPLTDTLASATLAIYIYDNASNEPAAEKLEYSLDLGALTGSVPSTNLNSNTVGSPFVASINVLTQVTADGTLNVFLSRQAGDFMFAHSVLSARGESVELASLPEPATVALLGIAAIASRFRRRHHRA